MPGTDERMARVELDGTVAPSPGRILTAGELDPWNLTPELLAKAMVSTARERPKAIRHNVSLAARRYLLAYTGILHDATPHLDAWILRQLSYRNPILNAVINTLLNQVSAHFTRPMHEKAVGMRVVQKDKRKALSPAAAKVAEGIESVLFNGGITTEHPKTGEPAVWDGHYQVRADTLDIAVRKLMRDSLTLDRIFISIEGSPKLGGRAKNPVMFWKAEDASLARVADPENYSPRIRHELDGKTAYIMLDPGMRHWGVMREYAWDEGAMAHRNPRTEFASFGYGKSEIEMCLDAVLGVLYGLRANQEYFTDNHIPMGILNLIGTYQEPELKALRLKLKQEVGFPGHYYEFPIISTPPLPGAKGAEWIPLQNRDRMDMVFRAYIEFCVAIAAAVFQMAPEEFGFASFGGPSSTVSEADPGSTLQHSMHKGLVPKVLWLAGFLTKQIVEKIDPDFEIEIQGLESVWIGQEMIGLQRDGALMQMGYSLNMIRARNDQPPVVDPLDWELWRQVEAFHKGQWYATETERVKTTAEHYKSLGGRIAEWPDAPFGNEGALNIWMMEHQQEKQSARQMMDQLGMAEVQGQIAGEQQMAQIAHQAEVEGEKQGRDHQHQMGMAHLQHGQQRELADHQARQQQEQLIAQHGLELEKLDRQGQQQVSLHGLQHQGELEKLGVQHGQAAQMAQLQHGQQRELKGVEHGHQMEQMLASSEVQGRQRLQEMDHQAGHDTRGRLLDAHLQEQASRGDHQRQMEHDLTMLGAQGEQQAEQVQMEHAFQMIQQEVAHGQDLKTALFNALLSALQQEDQEEYQSEEKEREREHQRDSARVEHQQRLTEAEVQALLQAVEKENDREHERHQAGRDQEHRERLEAKRHRNRLTEMEHQAAYQALEGEADREHQRSEGDRKERTQAARTFGRATGGLPYAEDGRPGGQVRRYRIGPRDA